MASHITPVNATETRRIVGRIVPATITTTAFVFALSYRIRQIDSRSTIMVTAS